MFVLRKAKKVISVLFCILLVFFSGCQKQNEQIYQSYINDSENMLQNIDISTEKASGSSDEKVIDETPGELTIYGTPKYFDWVVWAFNDKYPNIKVSFNHGSEGEYTSYSDYVAKASVDLMSGSAGDIVEIGTMPFIRFGKNNLLEDLYPYMENDPEFHKEEYYMNIFEALKYDDKLWAVPMSFFYRLVRFNKTLLEENYIEVPKTDSVDYRSIVDIYDKIAPQNDRLLISHYFSHNIFEETEYNRYLDEKQDRTYFALPEFIDFLNEMKKVRWPSEMELKLAQLNSSGQDYWDRTDENDLCLIVTSYYNEERNAKLFYEHPSNLTVPIPMSASNGDKHFHWDKSLSILSTSKNKELAWKFIRFSIEEKPLEMLEDDNIWPINGMPVNRHSTLKLLENAFGEGNEATVQMVDRWNSERNEGSLMSNALNYISQSWKSPMNFMEEE